MFPRQNRLRKSEDIIAVLRKGRRSQSGPVTCSFQAKAGSLSRVTVIVDTKVAKKATARNLLKRRTRSWLHTLGLPKGDLIIRLRPGATNLDYAELGKRIEECLKSLR